MRRVLALVLVIFLGVHSALAGVKKDQAKFIGGSESLPPTEAMGFVNTEDAFRLQFQYKAGKNSKVGKYTDGTFSLPYATVGKMIYGQEKHMRVGQTIALSALAGVGGLLLLLSKSHVHFLTIDYKDASGVDQTVSFEVGKQAIRPLLTSLELRTGKKVEYEVATTAQAQVKP